MAVTSEKKINDDEEEKRQMDDYVSRNTRVKGDAEGMKGGTNVPETRFVFFVKMRTGKLVIGEVEVQGRQEACAELPARDLKRLARVRGGTGRQIGVRRCAGDEYEVYGDDDRVKLDFGETIEVFDVKPGSGGGDNDGDALRRRLFPYLTFIKPDNTKVRWKKCTILFAYLYIYVCISTKRSQSHIAAMSSINESASCIWRRLVSLANWCRLMFCAVVSNSRSRPPPFASSARALLFRCFSSS